ncbi:MAG: hypothetical protein L7F77_16385 [Candidatus Magnetominusculus sp. LBB02]|nr:hypothetical protein [Candidatus Magnetominusculus sp. LBB02]MCG6553902.1 hypothetical protein [Candidatus Magnetominusculus sp. LBB02]
MNLKGLRYTAASVLVAYVLTACAVVPPRGTQMTNEQRQEAQASCIAQHTATGAIIGGLGVLALDNLLFGRSSGGRVAAGAVIGGTLGFAMAWGRCLRLFADIRSYPVAGAPETVRPSGYQPSYGSYVKFASMDITPETAAPGGKVKLNAVYYLMDPDMYRQVSVTEATVLYYYDNSKSSWTELGSASENKTVDLGTRRGEITFDIPKDAPEGSYKIMLKVTAMGREDSMAKDLMVRRG